MPPATESNYYIAIGEGIKDVINQKVSAIIISTHDEHAAAPLVKQAVAQGIAVVIVNIGYAQPAV
jgi:ribose transport system substrate-binding protein